MNLCSLITVKNIAAKPCPIVKIIITCELVEACFSDCYLAAKPCPIVTIIIPAIHPR